VHRPFQACLLASIVLVAASASPRAAEQTASVAAAQVTVPQPAPEMKPPHVVPIIADWDAIRAALPEAPAAASGPAAPPDPIVGFNDATKTIFHGIDHSPVPVLLPFDTASFLRDTSSGATVDPGKYFSGFNAWNFFFFAGPAGYDASFFVQPQNSAGLDAGANSRVEVQISASSVIYQTDFATAAHGSAVPELESKFPGLRRLSLENHTRFAFEHFGVPYVVTIMCHDGPGHSRRSSCHDADKVGILFLKALNVAGGAPQQQQPEAPPQTIDRPAQVSADFTYHPSGDILPGTGMRGQAGRPDTTVYAKIRFPMARAPSFVNSQTFMNWGDCDFTGRVALGGSGRNASYRCRVNSLTLVRDESKNYAYPWRDNFCEHRYFEVGQCPAGLGHQGEDIRPGSCKLHNAEADRCDPYQDNVVAVHDGIVLRTPGDEALYLVVNAPGEHIRFRYLHMDPRLLDAAGMVNGRRLRQGDVISAVDNYMSYQGGTTDHLHFDVQVLTRDGWMFVNPYMTLVAAYERLIGARGVLVKDPAVTTASVGAAATPTSPPSVTPPAGPQAAPPAGAVKVAPAASPQTTTTPASPQAVTSVDRAAAPATPHPATKIAPARTPQIHRAILRPRTPHEHQAKEHPHSHEHRASTAEHCKTRSVKGHRRRVCGSDVASRGERAGRHAHHVRSVGKRISRESRSARHHQRNLHASHGRHSRRHGRA
jgi:hypothetical protein